ncbi:MAG: hypothetical protein MUF49_31320 [Oculatellaceae cyanobacterium Prado106]|jgi:hypothetical protein|nr:hypothetical protein [Oculatellaceae cyanobacterium Prado106]
MLSQIVRPMVRTQIRLLANSQASRSTLVTTIAQWLGFLGVHAQVTQLESHSDRIQVSLTVGKPEACDTSDWEQILRNLNRTPATAPTLPETPAINEQQQRKLQRLLAYVIQVGEPDQAKNWERLLPQLQLMGFGDEMLAGIRAALKVPQSLEALMEGLDPDLAAIALSKAVGIALLDRQVNSHEDQALSALLEAMKGSGD